MISPSIVDFLTRGIQARGRAILFVPNFQSVYALKRELAAYPSLRGGVVVVRAEDWLRERWGLWADRALTPITSTARVLTIRALLDESLDESSEAKGDELTLSPNQGTIDLISELVECVLPELVTYVPGKEDTPSLAALVRFGARYQKTIHAEGRCELIETIPWLCESFTRTQLELPFCVVYGFCGMSHLEASLFEALARLTEFRSISEAASREEAKALATSSNASVSEQNFEPHSGPHSESNFDLHSGLHQLMLCLEEGRSHTLDPSEDVRLLLPAGAHAETELIARSILEDEPVSAKLLLTSPDPRRMFEELAPKLCAHAVEVSATLNQKLMSTETARAIFEYLSSVSELMILNESWPLPAVMDEFTTVDIPVGHMKWWPPTKLIDFLMSSCAHTSLAHSYRLDALWRGNRLLTPGDVLKTLTNPHSTSSVCARSCSLLMHGKLLQALSILAQAYLEPVSAEPADYSIDEYGDPKILSPRKENAWQREEARTVILKLMALVKDMQERPEFAPSTLETPSGLARAIETLQLLAHRTSIVLNPKLAPAAAAVESEAAAPAPAPTAPAATTAADIPPRKRLYIAAVTDASELEPASFDTVYITGQTSEESPLPDPDSLATSIARRLHVLHKLDPQAQFRSAYAKLMRLASHRLVFERVLFDRTGHVTYPSCILSDVLDCYKLVWDAQAQKFVNTLVSSRFALHASEEAVSNNLRIAAAPARMCASERPRPQGSIDSEHKELLCIAPAGTKDTAPHLPFVSASQIEAYLRCPYQWFCERRLALSELDAQCSQLEAGTFVHRVLELTHARLLTRAQERAASSADSSQGEELYIPGALADYDPAQAHDLLDKMFDMHKTHQYIRHNQKKYMREQIFVPHTVEDEGKLDGMRRDLHSFIDYESTVFQGFSPRFFELSFGKEEPFIQYGGAYVVGSIDRVDVDAHNNAIVIDYKNRSPRGFEKEYALSLDELIKQAEQDAEDSDVENSSACSFALPQHIQTLIYARMLSRLYPQLNVVGALYVSTKHPHAISGACDAGYLARIVGEDKLRASLVSQLAVPETFRCKESNEEGFAALLDAVEHMLSGVIASMQAGHIAAPAPSAEHLKACLYCKALLRNQHMTSLA